MGECFASPFSFSGDVCGRLLLRTGSLKGLGGGSVAGGGFCVCMGCTLWVSKLAGDDRK